MRERLLSAHTLVAVWRGVDPCNCCDDLFENFQVHSFICQYSRTMRSVKFEGLEDIGGNGRRLRILLLRISFNFEKKAVLDRELKSRQLLRIAK